MPIDIIIHPKIWTVFHELFDSTKTRYKVFYGGRGAGKSWTIAQALILKAYKSRVRILCTREIQRSIQESVHRLLSDQIEKMGLLKYFNIKNNEIVSWNKSQILFEGLYNNVNKIKSMEGIDICWLEEAEKISKNSWKLLIPTIRKENSEIWVSFNPDDESDETYQMFITKKKSNAAVKKVNYSDNPYFSEPLISEMEYDRKYNYSKYLNVWEGECISNYDACIYRLDRNINCVNYDIKHVRSFESCASWDFGVSDDTAIIFYNILQVPKTENNPKGIIINIFDEYCNNNQTADHYRKVIEQKEYNINTHYCDPSGASRESDLTSWIDKLALNEKTGKRDWHYIYSSTYSVIEMIDNANEVLPFIRYNPLITPHVHNMFRRWMYRTDKDGKIVLPPKPMHDNHSHFGTSFYYFCINRFPPKNSAGYSFS